MCRDFAWGALKTAQLSKNGPNNRSQLPFFRSLRSSVIFQSDPMQIVGVPDDLKR